MENVFLVFGGNSYEHDISVVTASQIFNEICLSDIRLIPLYVSKDNRFYVYNTKNFDITIFSKEKIKVKNKNLKEVTFLSGENNKIFIKTIFGLKEYLFVKSAIFACHGGLGEDGRLVSLFNFYGINCSAGNFDSLSLCMNKYYFKLTMKGLKIPVVEGFRLTKNDYENKTKIYEKNIKKLNFPLIIKICSGGSSIGVFVAKDKEEFKRKLNSAFEFDNELIIEKYIQNTKEYNIALRGNVNNFEISEVDEPLKENEIITFNDKYLSRNEKSKKGMKSMAQQKRNLPAKISKTLDSKIKKYAIKIFKELNLNGVVRIDFLYSEQTQKLYVCEVNAIPGSLAYYFFNDSKITFNSHIKKLLQSSNCLLNKINNNLTVDILEKK